ncbi:MAG: hypothetical protein RL495_899 [Verrucomicrobiota bacterium]|jgi:hypothetical protein
MKAVLLLLFTCCTIVAQENIETLSQLDDYRRKISGPYLKALDPIYRKADKATDEEQSAFIAAAIDLKALKAYMCPTYGKRISINKYHANIVENDKRLEALYKIMKEAKIKTSLPATRAELNEAQKFLDAFYKAMQLPVVLNS